VEKGGRFAMKLRVPYWATEGFSVKVNGKALQAAFQPSSYVEIPERDWATGDRVEVSMPYTKHLDFGPDKMDLAATGVNETRTPFAPMWEGTLMYGPLVMATPDISVWEQAEFDLNPDLSDIVLRGAAGGQDGTGGPLYSLTLGDKTFWPDYYLTDHCTHYLRLNVLNEGKKKRTRGVDKTYLDQAIRIARSRVEAQEAWNALETKVPAFAPWAPNGYERMLEQLAAAEAVNAVKPKALKQEDVTKATSALNAAINTMRPGNLAEPEDLDALLRLTVGAKEIPNKSTPLREAIDFADMVIQYVNDGSGTKDLIERARVRLEEALKTL
jgi:hypothetical protein